MGGGNIGMIWGVIWVCHRQGLMDRVFQLRVEFGDWKKLLGGYVWGVSGASTEACLGHHLGHVLGIIWGIIWGMSWASSGASSGCFIVQPVQ